MRVMLVILVAALAGGPVTAMGELPTYLWAEVSVPESVLSGLTEEAQTMSLPTAHWRPESMEISGAESLAELESAEQGYLLVDGPFFLVGWGGTPTAAMLRGREGAGELILRREANGVVPQVAAFLDLLDQLGLLPENGALDLAEREVPIKLPRAPEDVRLDSVLWALVVHPDWFGFAEAQGLERVGLRVRVVAETDGDLDEAFEPFIEASSNALVELLIPIPLLPELGRDPSVLLVREPFRPHPAQPVGGDA